LRCWSSSCRRIRSSSSCMRIISSIVIVTSRSSLACTGDRGGESPHGSMSLDRRGASSLSSSGSAKAPNATGRSSCRLGASLIPIPMGWNLGGEGLASGGGGRGGGDGEAQTVMSENCGNCRGKRVASGAGSARGDTATGSSSGVGISPGGGNGSISAPLGGNGISCGTGTSENSWPCGSGTESRS